MPILIKPLLFLIAFGPMAVLFASVIGLACGLLTLCVRAIARLVAATEILLECRKSTELTVVTKLDALTGGQFSTR